MVYYGVDYDYGCIDIFKHFDYSSFFYMNETYFSSVGLRELKKQHYRQQQYILACMVHCGNVLSMIITWSLSSALTSEGADWDTLLLTDSRVNIFMHKSWFINNSLTLTTNSKSMEKYSIFEQIVINIYMKFIKWH